MSKLDKSTIENLETYKDLFDNAHDLIHIVYPDGAILYVNKAWEALLEYSQEEVQGHSLYSFVTPEDRQSFKDYREQLLRENKHEREVVVRFRSRSGKDIALEGFVSVRRQNQEAIYTRGIFRDITVRLQNEHQLMITNQALREREMNLEQLLTHAPDAIVVINNSSTITYWNPKAAVLFGWTVQEALGKNLSDTIIPPQYREAHNRGMNRYLATGEAQVLNTTIEITAQKKEGTEFYISLTISTTQQHGKPAFIAFIRDIEKEKRNELELEKKRRELEQSNEQLEQFAHVASHDMKEPVRKIKLFAEQLKLEAGAQLSQRARNFIDRIDVSASRINRMIEGVLAHSSLDAVIPSNEKVNLDDILQQVLTDLELVIQTEKAVVRVAALPEIEGAAFLLYQLFYNLVSNALKFVRPGIAPVINIEGHLTTPENGSSNSYALITIRDNGIGFSNKDAARIFKKFSRLHSKDKYEGTGLGLALCKSIVEKHKGSIEATAEDGGGAVFTILLPEKQ